MYKYLVAILFIGFTNQVWAQAQPAELGPVLEKFFKERCQAFSIQNTSVKETAHEVAAGLFDNIYEVSYDIRWNFDGTHPLTDYLSVKVVNRVEGDWFVYAGTGTVCDFEKLPSYSE